MAGTVGEGDKAPGFELLDDAGARVRLEDFEGQPVVLYFYPKDDTPGCTVEACGFRDAFKAFEARDVIILGVSPDDAASHRAFRRKFRLPFQLLCDPGHKVAEAYGAWGRKTFNGREFEGILRSTFVIGGDGRILRAFRDVNPEGHWDEVLAALPPTG